MSYNPALDARTAMQGFDVAIGATLRFSLLGSLFMRRLGRSLATFKRMP